jgi:hypothetical protein
LKYQLVEVEEGGTGRRMVGRRGRRRSLWV